MHAPSSTTDILLHEDDISQDTLSLLSAHLLSVYFNPRPRTYLTFLQWYLRLPTLALTSLEYHNVTRTVHLQHCFLYHRQSSLQFGLLPISIIIQYTHINADNIITNIIILFSVLIFGTPNFSILKLIKAPCF